MGEESPHAAVIDIRYLPTNATVRSASVAHVTTHTRTSPAMRNDVDYESAIPVAAEALNDTVPLDTSDAVDLIPAPVVPLRMHPARHRNLQSAAKPQHSFPPELSRAVQNRFRGFKAKERKHLWKGLQYQLNDEESQLFLRQTKGWHNGENDQILKRWDVEVKKRRDGKKAALRQEALREKRTTREMGECLEMMEGLGIERGE